MKSVVVIYAAAFSGVLACAHQPEKVATIATPGAGVQPQNVVASTAQASAARSCTSDGDCADKQLCIRAQCVDITPDLAECSTVRVHFDFNEAQLRESDTAILQRMGRCLKADHELHVTIEGNADERGTEEWNLALGDKRVTAVAQYLERLGVSQAQLRTVTFGKEHPLCVQHNEECWAKNRRAALKPNTSR
jgi:peptidoglycan-associated lipoprotein